MMMFIFCFMFMIPVLFFDFWFMFQYFILSLFFFFFFFNYYFFFCKISYFLGFDYFSYFLIILSLLITSLMFLSSVLVNMYSRCMFSFMCLFLCLLLILVFSTMNMILMYIFFELTLIPLMILILGWGYQPERLLSGFYLFFYTLFGSLPLLCFIIYFYFLGFSMFFDFGLSFNFNFFSHFCLIFAFLIKVPMFMFHFWLPSAHVQAPVSGSMILAGLMLKIGGYGIFRFMFIYDFFFFSYSFFWFSLSLTGSVIVSLICFLQSDLKCLIAYSSVCHMGFCLCGLLTMTKIGVLSCLFMMLSHGLCSSALFFLANCCYDRLFSRSFYLNKGMIFFMPSMSFNWFIFCSFNMGCPPSLGFFSEVFIIISCMSFWSGSFLLIGLISFLSACFSFYLYSYCQHGVFSNLYSFSMVYVREYLVCYIHLYLLLIMVFFISLV